MSLNLYSAGKIDALLSGKLSISSLSNAATTTLNATAPTAGQALTFDGTDLVWATVGGGGGASWGSITGTLSSQSDLWTALSALAPTASPSFSGTVSIAGSWGSITFGDGTTGSLVVYNGSQTTTYGATGITFPDSTVQTTAATYDVKRAIANACASCFSANVYSPNFQFIGHVAMALYMSGKFSGSGQYLLGVGTPGYSPSTLSLSTSNDAVGNVTASSSFSWTSVAGQSIAYSDDYGSTWTYSDLVI